MSFTVSWRTLLNECGILAVDTMLITLLTETSFYITNAGGTFELQHLP